MTAPLAALALTVGCTAPDGASPDRGAGPVADTRHDSTGGSTPGSPPTAAEESAGAGTQPLLLVRHATLPRPRLGVRRARRLIEGWDPDVAPREVLARVVREPGHVGVVPADAVDARVRAAVVAGVDPLVTPEEYPFQVPGPAPAEPVVLTVAGDLMLARGVTDPEAALAPMGPRLAAADLTVANLESTLSRAGPPTQGGDSFGADPGVVRVLEAAGIDAVSLANNHAGDFGNAALLETVRRLRRSDVTPFGAGRDRRAAARPAVLTRAGVRFGFLGFNAIGETPRATASSPGALSVRMPPRTGPLVPSDLRDVLRDVRRLARDVDVVVVLPHWGTQYTHRPEPIQREVGRRLISAGADLVVGGHPHWVQGLEWHRGRLLAHSLGNFVFDMDFMTETQQGALLEATFWGARLMGVDLVPYRMDPAFAPRPARGREAAEILQDVWSTSTGPFAP